MQVFVGKKCGGSHRAPNGIRSDGEQNPIGRRTESDRVADGIRSGGGRCTVAEHQLQHYSYCDFSIFSPNFYKQKCRGFRDNLYLCKTRSGGKSLRSKQP